MWWRAVEFVDVFLETAAMTAAGRPWWLMGGGESIRMTPVTAEPALRSWRAASKATTPP